MPEAVIVDAIRTPIRMASHAIGAGEGSSTSRREWNASSGPG
jgi:hypothetical protein